MASPDGAGAAPPEVPGLRAWLERHGLAEHYDGAARAAKDRGVAQLVALLEVGGPASSEWLADELELNSEQRRQLEVALGTLRSSRARDDAELAREKALAAELEAQGAQVGAVRPGVRPDGVRGIFAARDLDAEEVAIWVPQSLALTAKTCDAGLLEAIHAAAAGCGDEMMRDVYSRMAALVVGYLLEKHRGPGSRFALYIEALPEYPPTANTFFAEERVAIAMMTGGRDFLDTYKDLQEVAVDACRRGAQLWAPSEPPGHEQVAGAFYFVLSRMSYLRLIPWIDLVNAALPGEENSRILVDGQVVDGSEGCALKTKRPVAAGEELLIDYNHHDALSMLQNYGCTLGLEQRRSVTRIQYSLPPWLRAYGDAGLERGVQLAEEQPLGVSDQALILLRMAAVGDHEELLTAIRAGFFAAEGEGDAPVEAASTLQRWHAEEARLLVGLADFAATRRREWELNIGPAVAVLDVARLAGGMAAAQYATELRLLQRFEDAFRLRAAACEAKAAEALRA